MDMASTPKSGCKSFANAVETKARLELCWKVGVNWDLYPSYLREGCKQIGKAISMPPSAVLSGLLITTGFAISHGSVSVPQTEWVEPIIVWISIGMPTGSGKSPLYKYLLSLLRKTRAKLELKGTDPSWLLEEATFEKMGAMMYDNYSKLLGLYDELSSFLTQINLYKSRGLSDSHDLALFLQLYNGHPWARKTVTGDANFVMDQTSLTVGGFTQPAVARALIEMPSNIEKGLSTRFLWTFPKPCYSKFDSLEPIHEQFTDELVKLYAELWTPDSKTAHAFVISSPCETFTKMFDETQEKLDYISGMDELLSGMLSKAKGLVLRIAGVMHVLFRLGCSDQSGSNEISEAAMKAAIDYVEVSCKHTAFLAGRGDLEEAIQDLLKAQTKGSNNFSQESTIETGSFILKIPGTTLDISHLNGNHKFRKYGRKDGAIAAIKHLEQSGLGEVVETKATRGTAKLYSFVKKAVPTSEEEKEEFVAALGRYGVSVKQYAAHLTTPKKRPGENLAEAEVRRSPRLDSSRKLF